MQRTETSMQNAPDAASGASPGELRARTSLRPFAEHPGKRATERFWLLYTPVWGLAAAVVMMGGFAERWGDVELMLFSVVLSAGALLGPLVFRCEEERGLPWFRLAGAKLGASVTGLAVLMNYGETPFFFDVLHMHYGFDTRWNIQHAPIQMYVLTITYFCTYCALLNVSFRALRSAWAERRRGLFLLATALLPFVVAFLETALNANPFIPTLFCYDDLPFTLSFGTFCYGLAFCVALPMWIRIDERRDRPTSWLNVGIWLLAAVQLNLLALDVLRYHVAPHFTTVVEGANGLRDYDTSCLQRPEG